MRMLGRPAALTLAAAVGLGLSACDRGGTSAPSSPTPSTPAPTVTAVDAVLTFTVYNHTAGPLGTFTRTARSGTDVTLQIASLAPGISVAGVDPQRIVVREAAQGGRIGNFIAFSNQGAVRFTVPWAIATPRYDVFLMNNTPPCDTFAERRFVGSFYHEVDSRWPVTLTSRLKARSMTAFRPADDGVVGAPDEPIDTAIKLFHGVMNYPWMSYGSYTRTEGSGDVSLQYGWWSWCAGHYSGWGGNALGKLGGISACFPNLNPLWVGWQQNLFQILLGLIHIDPTAGYTDSHFVLARSGGYSPIGRDLIAYVYVRDPKGW